MSRKTLIAAFLLGCCVAGAVQQWRLGARLAQGETDLANARRQHEADGRAVSDIAASAASAALAETACSASAVAAVDQHYRTEQTHAQ